MNRTDSQLTRRRRLRSDRQLHLPITEEGELVTDFTRASGLCVCRCGEMYFDHPPASEPQWVAGDGRPFLRRICGGRLVKL